MRLWRIPLDIEKQKVPRGTIYLVKERCKGCEFCVEYCPRDVLAMSSEYNAKGYHFPYPKTQERCVNCDLCETICPEFAIFCLGEDEQEGTCNSKP